MEKTKEQKEALARQLKEWFGLKGDGPCACLGIECQDFGCLLWWEFFLDLSPDQLENVCKDGVKHAYDVRETDFDLKQGEQCKK